MKWGTCMVWGVGSQHAVTRSLLSRKRILKKTLRFWWQADKKAAGNMKPACIKAGMRLCEGYTGSPTTDLKNASGLPNDKSCIWVGTNTWTPTAAPWANTNPLLSSRLSVPQISANNCSRLSPQRQRQRDERKPGADTKKNECCARTKAKLILLNSSTWSTEQSPLINSRVPIATSSSHSERLRFIYVTHRLHLRGLTVCMWACVKLTADLRPLARFGAHDILQQP